MLKGMGPLISPVSNRQSRPASRHGAARRPHVDLLDLTDAGRLVRNIGRYDDNIPGTKGTVKPSSK